jgi:hypothetical protein
MRVSAVLAAITLMAAAPVSGQSKPNLASRTTLPAHVMCADLLVPAMPLPSVWVRGGHHSEQRQTLGRDDVIVVARAPNDGLAVGQRYLVRRLPTGAHAELPKAGGYVPIRTPGWVTVTSMDDLNALAHVDYSCDSIEAGDYLEPYAEPVLPTPDVNLAAPDFTERVQILPGTEGRVLFADGDSFSIARGTEHGVTIGARYAIYRDHHDGKPLVLIGEAIVTDPSATSSKVLLMKTTNAVETKDVAVPRR